MCSILKPPLGMRKHMDSKYQSSLVHECQNLTNPPPHGQKWCNKKQQISHHLGHKKVLKPLVTPINAPYLPGVGVGVLIDRCIIYTTRPFTLNYSISRFNGTQAFGKADNHTGSNYRIPVHKETLLAQSGPRSRS